MISTFTEDSGIREVNNKKLMILLVKRTDAPYSGMWALPGGFVDHDKPLIQCVNEKLHKKTGAKDVYVEQLYTYGDNVFRDPRDRVISVGYIALLSQDRINEHFSREDADFETSWFIMDPVLNNDNIEDVRFIPVQFNGIESSGVYLDNLAFDHKDIVIDALNRLRNKVMYTDVAFSLAGDTFTISELEKCYEAITLRKIPGFRRIIAPKIEEVTYSNGTQAYNNDLQKVGYRPSKIYKRRV